VLQPSPIKENLILRFERREAGGKQETDTTKNFSGEIEIQDGMETLPVSEVAHIVSSSHAPSCDLDGLSLSWLLGDRAICLLWDHSIDDNSAVSSDIFSSWDTWKPYRLGTSSSIYALDSNRTTPLVEEVLRQDVIYFS
jgi:hypothetical protein